MRIPFLDLRRLHDSIRSELDEAYERIVRSSDFVEGDAVRQFEDAFAFSHERAGGAACGSGTDALALALRAHGVGPGDEVIVPSMTFVATAEAVVHVGATPVIADVNEQTLLLDDACVSAVETSRTRAVVPVHLYGHPVPFDDISRWRSRGLLVVEDAAQAHLATWEDRFVGSVGHAACFSFYAGKNLGALGDGGMVISDDAVLIGQVRKLRDHGRADKYVHDEMGWCSRLDGMQAAFLSVKLSHLPAWTAGRRRLAGRYRSNLAGAQGVTVVPWDPGAVHHLLVVQVENRSRVQEALATAGVPSGIHYPVVLSQQPSLKAWHRPTPAAESAADRILSLPMDPLMADHEVDTVCEALIEAVG